MSYRFVGMSVMKAMPHGCNVVQNEAMDYIFG
jgi:hypothetical protein